MTVKYFYDDDGRRLASFSEDNRDMEPVTDLSEFLDTIEYLGANWEVRIKENKPHILIVNNNGEAMCQFVFDENETFEYVTEAKV